MENRGIVNIALFFIKDANRIDCCACRTLLLQPDCICKNLNFKERRGHKCVFYPKYHCELNHIGYTWTGLQQTVPKALDSAKIEDMNKNHGTIWIFIEKVLLENGSSDWLMLYHVMIT
ncbi:uncharacterized protein OCT59_001323 [Rhizophagus irregularis]|uniref:Uncharacterized protein n=1 Tax=Rhizophagus irregularis (strain DAOM 197198w) TaxID=1432141 RepID=A0A015IKI5_RHIIW|nr:hypothetical protein RirG_205130 [Rhizophagus irregularis DAOM 197198w]UZO00069.1 hypothetical protein OCT59_001323 [Rhizophagus irregularis]